MQPRILGKLECAAASALKNQIARAQKPWQLRLKTYVRRHARAENNQGTIEMGEIRSFLRHAIPGGVLLLSVFFYFCVLSLPRVEVLLGVLFFVLSKLDDLGLAAGLAFLTPLLGYLVGTIHHFFYDTKFYPRVDHTRFLSDFRTLFAERVRAPRALGPLTPNMLVDILWHTGSNDIAVSELVENRNNLYSHITHGNGANLIAACLAFPIALFLGYLLTFLDPNRSWYMSFLQLGTLVFALGVYLWQIAFSCIIYISSIRKQQSFVESSLLSLRHTHRRHRLPPHGA